MLLPNLPKPISFALKIKTMPVQINTQRLKRKADLFDQGDDTYDSQATQPTPPPSSFTVPTPLPDSVVDAAERDSYMRRSKEEEPLNVNAPNPYVAQQAQTLQSRMAANKKPKIQELPTDPLDEKIYSIREVGARDAKWEQATVYAMGMGLGAGLVAGFLVHKWFFTSPATTYKFMEAAAEAADDVVA